MKPMTVEEAITFLDNLVYQQTEKNLSRLQQSIIKGVLTGLTYQEIQQNDPIARGYTVGYLGRYVGYKLWKDLTKVLKQAEIIRPEERVVGANLWDCIMRSLEKGTKPVKSVDPILQRLLRMRYRIREHLVSTEYSDTYLAEDENLPDRPLCLVKRLKSQSEKTSKLFDLETRVLYRLGQHDRIPELLARFEEDGYFYLVYQFIEGQPLYQELIEGQPWKEHQVIALLKDILEVLVFVHKENVIHRDLHPQNLIKRSPDNKIVLIDFGAVKEINTSQNSNGQTKSRGGGTHQEYIPPEQAIGAPKFCSDIYAVGIIGIQALTGMRPKQLKVDNLGNLIWQKNATVTPELASILDQMVLYSFPQRYQSATEALEAVQNLVCSH
ncbi:MULTISPECIES: serine/threonine-protein kinase [unclassified Microcoleus]|jgi:eukaryotic-like serine/threonine-protein kinase|uniref:serine/threonine-protein kinase n=2 Tax=unclassified Microcoleus TaxID=2642155 RepID=UPI0025D3E257|nr:MULTISPECIES: serine/threonine-protein kinase [unclassified Microcoleus]